MTMHLFGTVLTAKAVAANNRGESEGTVSTLQKIIRNGDIFTTVSAEAIRYGMREVWQIDDKEILNRRITPSGLEWQDRDFREPAKYLDDDVLGFMNAGQQTRSRRGALEITRAVSTVPWAGTLSTSFASPHSNPGLNNADPIPYQVEIHDTRYQYSFAMTPDYLGRDQSARTGKALRAIQNLRRVAGNHARFLFDFSPEVIVLRWSPDPAPRMLLCFDEDDRGNVSLRRLGARLQGDEKDIDPSEIVIGTVLEDVRGLDEIRLDGLDLRLMTTADVHDIPTVGKNLIVLADVDNVVHFRIFDGDGKTVVDTDAKKLSGQSGLIEDLSKQTRSLFPPHKLTASEKARVINDATSIVGQTKPRVAIYPGVKAAVSEAIRRIELSLQQGGTQTALPAAGTPGKRSSRR